MIKIALSLATLMLGLSAIAADQPQPGSHAELRLRPLVKAAKGAPASPPELISFRSGNEDDLGFNRIVQDITVPTVTVYRPARPAHRGAALVVCPGGGYSMEVIDREGHAIARYFSQQGLTVAVLKYRLPSADTFAQGIPASQQDALEAIRFMRGHADEWGFAKDRIGIMGFSAGGHLAGSTAILGNAADGSRADFSAMLYPVVVMEGQYVHQGSREHLIGTNPTPERVAEFSLERRARPGLPPFFLCHARDDKGVPFQNSELLANALKAANVPAEMLIVESGGHGFALGRDAESGRWKDRFLTWLDGLP